MISLDKENKPPIIQKIIMNEAEITLPEQNGPNKAITTIQKTALSSHYFLVLIYFVFNFIGSPALKPLYLLFCLSSLLLTLLLPQRYAILLSIIALMLEGQGKVLLNFSLPSKLVVDILLIVSIAKGFTQTKKLVDIKKVSTLLYICILLHFIWFIFQLFNVNNVGFLEVFVTSKIYIFPIFFFFHFLNNPFDKEFIEEIKTIVLFLLLAQSILIIYQMGQREDFLIRISQGYAKAMQDVFTGVNFRPFGTGFLPGQGGYYTFLFLGILFITPTKSKFKTLLSFFSIPFITYALFLCQVRSTLIKEILLLMACALTSFTITKEKAKKIIGPFFLFIILIVSFFSTNFSDKFLLDSNTEKALERLQTLTDIDHLGKQRLSPSRGFFHFYNKLSENPLGLGPGRTAGSKNFSKDAIKRDKFYGDGAGWAYDNLLISLAIDFGLGFIFYAFIIFFTPIKLMYLALIARKRKRHEIFRYAMISASFCLILLFFNWGSIGIPYNPESFAFWFWLAFGINAIHQQREPIPNEAIS